MVDQADKKKINKNREFNNAINKPNQIGYLKNISTPKRFNSKIIFLKWYVILNIYFEKPNEPKEKNLNENYT